MPKIESYPILNFSGGVRRDKSLFELQKNELLDARNIIFDDRGRLVVRRGSQQFGTTVTGNVENSFVYSRKPGGANNNNNFIINNNASSAVLSYLAQTRLDAAVATTDTTITVVSNTPFVIGGAGTLEIDGDLISYTNTNGTTQFTGCSGIRVAHSLGAGVHQWRTLTQATTMDGRSGISYAVLNNILFLSGRVVFQQFAGNPATGTANVTNGVGLFVTNYRDRLYLAGDGATGTNGLVNRVSFSSRGDGSIWADVDFFDVEEYRNESISGFKVNNDRLWIFKPNSMFSYDEIELKIRQNNVGAYNHKVVQEIDNLIYTFCPKGIFVGNGFDMKQIGEPVRQYWENFIPTWDGQVGGRVVTNTFSGRFKNHYYLYIFDITDPTSTTDVVLDYDIKTKSWTIHDSGFTDFFHFGSYERFLFGESITNVTQFLPALFGGDSNGKMYRFFESKYRDNSPTPTIRGSDIFPDLVSDSAGAVVSGVIETPMYDLTHPELYKTFRYLRIYSERGQWEVSYRVENELGISEYRPLGTALMTNNVLSFPSEAAGWRIGLKFASSTTAHTPILNGFVFEDTEVIKRP